MQQQTSVLETLVYLFDYLVYEQVTPPSAEELHAKLRSAGFHKNDVDRAMTWLLELNDLQETDESPASTSQAIRLFTDAECDKILEEGRDCLHQLVRLGVIDAHLREVIIHKLMTLDESDITADEIRWVALMAIYNRKGKETSVVWLEKSLLEQNDMFYIHTS